MILRPRKLVELKDEEWRVIPDSDDLYFISNYGRVKSFANKEDGEILKGNIIKGFKTANFKVKKKKQSFYIHRLVAGVWLPKPADDCNYVVHLDGNKKNNRVSNLTWMTKEKMLEHKNRIRKKVIKISNSKLKFSDVRVIKSMLQKGVNHVTIAKLFCISGMQVTRIKRGENWGHVNPLEP